MPNIVKGETATVQTQTRTYSYQYADLHEITLQVLSRLNALGVTYTTAPTLTDDGHFVLEWLFTHVPSGDSKGGRYPLPIGKPQDQGAAQTYARRYCLCAYLGIAPVGDDADAAERAAREERAEERAAQPPTAGDIKKYEYQLTHAKTVDEIVKLGEEIGRRLPASEERNRLSRLWSERKAELQQDAAHESVTGSDYS
jgi:hypothetical protein